MLGSWRWGVAQLGGRGPFYVGTSELSQLVQVAAASGSLIFAGAATLSQPVQTFVGLEISSFEGDVISSQPVQTISASGSVFNVYCTLPEAELYISTLCFSTAWTGKTDQQKRAALISATRWLDTLQWKGMRTTEGQPLQWPRCQEYTVQYGVQPVVSSYCLLDRDGYEVATDTIPESIKYANAEMALRLLAEDRAADAGAMGPSSMKIGPLDLQDMKRRLFPPSVLELCSYWLKRQPGACRVVRA